MCLRFCGLLQYALRQCTCDCVSYFLTQVLFLFAWALNSLDMMLENGSAHSDEAVIHDISRLDLARPLGHPSLGRS